MDIVGWIIIDLLYLCVYHEDNEDDEDDLIAEDNV